VLERLTIQDWKLKDQIAELENAGMENDKLENDGPKMPAYRL